MAILSNMPWIAAVILIIGFILIAIELTVPGLSAPGILGMLCLVLGVVMASETVTEGIVLTTAVILLLAIMVGLFLWLFSKGKGVAPMILAEKQVSEEGYVSKTDLSHLVGATGEAITDLRPTGVGEFEGKKYNVVSDGGYILKGSKIKVTQVKDLSVIVTVWQE